MPGADFVLGYSPHHSARLRRGNLLEMVLVNRGVSRFLVHVEPFPSRECSKIVSREVLGGSDRFCIRSSSVQLQEFGSVITKTFLRLFSKGLSSRLFRSEEDEKLALIGVPSCQQRHMTLPSLRVDRLGIGGQEIAVEVWAEASTRFRRSLQQFVRRLGADFRKRMRTQRFREFHTALLAFGERNQRKSC